MSYTLEQFSADCRHILTREPGPAGREKLREKLAQLLGEEDFIAAHCSPDAPVGRHTLHDDPELGFQILAHIMKNDHDGQPHDHGASWAVYGQAVKHTDMTVWKRLDDASEDGKADINATGNSAWSRARWGYSTRAPSTPSAIPAAAASCGSPAPISTRSSAAASMRKREPRCLN